MKLRFNGVRGSRPTHKVDLLHFGGNSTSLEFFIEKENLLILLDGGSGIAHRKEHSFKTPNYFFLMTHTHWDHLLGFPFFKALYQKENHLTFYASQTSQTTFKKLFYGLQNKHHLPVPAEQLQATISFQTVYPGKDFKIADKVHVSCYQINHQGVTLGYRLGYGHSSAALITDNAPIQNNYMGEGMKEKAKGREKEFEKEFNDGLVAFLKGCHTVIFDTHFTEGNLKADWGHSTPERAFQFCKEAGVKRLILFHHAPEDTDHDVRQKVAQIVSEGEKIGLEIVAAREGDEWTLC